MVTKLGMSDEIGLQSLEDKDVKVYNEHTNVKIDQAIHENTFVAQGIAKRILEDKKKEVVQLSELLFQKETLEHEDILRVLGARSFDPTEAYKNYLEETAKGATKST
jgi:AFG3 family protein